MNGPVVLSPEIVDLGHLAADPRIEGSESLFRDLALLDCHRLLERSGWVARTSQPAQCLYRPGRSLVIRRTVWAQACGEERRFSVVREAHAHPIDPPAEQPGNGLVRIPYQIEAENGCSWVFPFDPYLPDLPVVLSVEGARRVAEEVVGYRCSVRSSVVRYRPARRAVIRFEVRPRGQARAQPVVIYLKVQPAPMVRHILETAAMLDGVDRRLVLPHARPRPGTLAYLGVKGVEMRKALLDRDRVSGAVRSPDMLDVAARLASLGSEGMTASTTPLRRLGRAAALLSATLPGGRHRLDDVGRRIEEMLDLEQPPVRRPVHGDLYEGQMMIDDSGAVVGVLDLDGVGVGELEMDIANALAHLRALGESHPHARASLEGHRRALAERAQNHLACDPRRIAVREAIAMLQLATGPFRAVRANWVERTEARIELAARILEGGPI